MYMKNEIRIPQTTIDLKNCFTEEEFVVKTCQQINKDLVGLVDNPEQFNIDLDGDVLGQMTITVERIIKGISTHNLQQFMYKVDLNESTFLNLLGDKNATDELAFLIIKREAQKIYLRKQFG